MKPLVKYTCMSLRADQNLLRYPVIFLFKIETKEYPTSNRMKKTKKKKKDMKTRYCRIIYIYGATLHGLFGGFFGVFVWMSFRGCFCFSVLIR